MSIGDTRWTHHVGIGYEMALGRYWVHAYLGEQKIGEATFETVPAPKPQSIRGVVISPGGQQLDAIALEAVRGEEEFSVYIGPGGPFDAALPPGSYIIKVYGVVGAEWHFVGWYDGSGSITTDPSEAFEVIVDGADVEGISITLPTDPEGLLCPVSGTHRSTQTGRCGS